MTLKHALALSAAAAALATVSGLAPAQTAQPVVPPAANTTVTSDKATTEADRGQLRADRRKTKADREKLKADRASGNTAAAQADEAQLKSDKAAQRAERQAVNGAHSTTEAARHHGNKGGTGTPTPPVSPNPAQ